jgi:hypothetical protein
MTIQEVTEPSEILVCFTRAGRAAHALHIDCRTVLGPWINFTSAETLEKALRYLGATDEQIAEHQNQMRRCGHGSSNERLLPNPEQVLPDRLEQALKSGRHHRRLGSPRCSASPLTWDFLCCNCTCWTRSWARLRLLWRRAEAMN